MKPITTIHLAQRLITLEEDALQQLNNYLQTLKNFFAKEESGDEIYNDIENRVAEILDKKLKNGKVCIATDDVNEMIGIVGTPEDLGIKNESGTSYETINNNNNNNNKNDAPKRLMRNANDKVFSGLASGIAAYFNMDPIWVRLLFVLAFFGGGIGLIGYIIMSIVVPSNGDIVYTNKRMFRDPDDKIIAGVCSGLANYFHTTAMNIRLVFAAPLAINIIYEILMDNVHYFHHTIEGFIPLSFMTYIVLWIIMPMAKTTGEKLQMKGEDVNINTIRNEVYGTATNTVAVQHRSGCGNVIIVLLKAFVYFILGCIAFGLLMGMFGMFSGGMAVLPFASFIFTDGNQIILATAGWLLFFALPIVAIVTLLFRRIIGFKEIPRYIINSLVGGWLIGLCCILFLFASFTSEFKVQGTIASTNNTIATDSTILHIKLNDTVQNNKIFTSYNWLHTKGFEIQNNQLFLKNIDVQLYKSPDSNYHYQICKAARGTNDADANKRIESINFTPTIVGNTIYLPKGFLVPKGDVFRGQIVHLKIYVPEGKKVNIDPKVEDELTHFEITLNERNNIHFSNHNNTTDDLSWDTGKDLLMQNCELMSKDDIAEAQQDVKDSINDAKEEMLDSIKEATENKLDSIKNSH